MIFLGSRLIACCKLAPTLARQMWRHNYVIDRNEYLIFTFSESINPWVYSLQFLFKSTNNSWRYERKCEWVFFFWTQCISTSEPSFTEINLELFELFSCTQTYRQTAYEISVWIIIMLMIIIIITTRLKWHSLSTCHKCACYITKF